MVHFAAVVKSERAVFVQNQADTWQVSGEALEGRATDHSPLFWPSPSQALGTLLSRELNLQRAPRCATYHTGAGGTEPSCLSLLPLTPGEPELVSWAFLPGPLKMSLFTKI